MIRVIEAKLYLNERQRQTLESWLRTSCWLYNKALEQRIKAYRRRGESIGYYSQQKLLTGMRGRMGRLESLPAQFARDALRRADRGMQAFFRRCRTGESPGFPRFRSRHRYNSLEQLAPGAYMIDGAVKVPKIGTVRSRGRAVPAGTQKGIRIIRRASGWYAQVLVDDGKAAPEKRPIQSAIGIDAGLNRIATMSDGSSIQNPRYAQRAQRRLRAEQRRVSRRKKGSRNRRKAVKRLQRQHERVRAQRRSFSHEHTTALVRRHDLIGIEQLNVKGMVRSRFGKSILDAAWSTLTSQLKHKAEWAGASVVEVSPRGTSQTCPDCGAVEPKKLSERIHECTCGLRCDRDHAAARVILARALDVHRGDKTPVENGAAVGAIVSRRQVPSEKQEDSRSALRCVK